MVLLSTFNWKELLPWDVYQMADRGRRMDLELTAFDELGSSALAPMTLDQLDYMADLIAELREMASHAGLGTLAGILALAQSEAGQQIARRRRP